MIFFKIIKNPKMKKKIINLYWYKHADGHGNFGDEVSPYIIEKLSGKKIKHFDIGYISNNNILNLKILLKNLYLKKITFNEFINYFSYRYLGSNKVILSIGSILVYKEDRRVVVWGSGILNKTSNFGNANFVAVRGYRTIDKLRELNYNIPEVVGDPALLLPRVYMAKNPKKYKLGIIPHFRHYSDLKKLENDYIKVIDLCGKVEDVIEDMNSCEFTISTSLHGIIVSHAYGIPSLWIDFKSENKLAGDNIKFDDYFSSVKIDTYQPFIINIEEFSLENIVKLFKTESQFLPTTEIVQEIQNNLIRVAPFFVKEDFKSIS